MSNLSESNVRDLARNHIGIRDQNVGEYSDSRLSSTDNYRINREVKSVMHDRMREERQEAETSAQMEAALAPVLDKLVDTAIALDAKRNKAYLANLRRAFLPTQEEKRNECFKARIALMCVLFPMFVPLPPAGLILGLIAKKEIKKNPQLNGLELARKAVFWGGLWSALYTALMIYSVTH